MPQAVQTEQRAALFTREHAGTLVATIAAALIVSVAGGALSVWVAQARTSDRITTVEAAVESNKAENSREVRELREEMVTQKEFDARWKLVEKIDQTVEKIRDTQVQERNRREK